MPTRARRPTLCGMQRGDRIDLRQVQELPGTIAAAGPGKQRAVVSPDGGGRHTGSGGRGLEGGEASDDPKVYSRSLWAEPTSSETGVASTAAEPKSSMKRKGH